MPRSGPIFIVGASRSGTALMRASLNAHPGVSLAGETHYFDDLAQRLTTPSGAPLPDDEANLCREYFLALGHRPYGHGGQASASAIDATELTRVAASLGGSSDSYFESFCRISADVQPHQRWGEKTPRHVYRIPEILGRYPDAQIICMVRDPRAVQASYRNWRNQGGFDLEADPGHRAALEEEQARVDRSHNTFLNAMLWRSSVMAAAQARRREGAGSVRIQRYEDLVLDPDSVLAAIAGWLDIPDSPEMRRVPVSNSSFTTFDPQGGFDRSAIDRWRQTLTEDEIAVVQACCGRFMDALGYERTQTTGATRAVVTAALSVPSAALRAARANHERIPNLASYVWRRLVG